MKRILPILLAVIVFVAAFVLLQPAPSQTVIVAARDLRAGHVLTEADLALEPVPSSLLAEDTVQEIALLVGQTLRIDRGQGDVIRLSQLGEMVALAADERALAIQISDPTGLSGLLVPGQQVGVVAVLNYQGYDSQGTFSKAVIEGLRVLYVDPLFSALEDTTIQPASTPGGFAAVQGVSVQERAREGTVILAIPTDLQTIFYDFTSRGKDSESQSRSVNALELLAALNEQGATIVLYLMPSEDAKGFTSPGLWLPDLIVTPEVTPIPDGIGE